MSLSVIGAGFGRTGTLSAKLALEMLGFGPCHHMGEVLSNPQQLALWRRAAQGNLPDWDEAYSAYKSAVDWPTAHYWRELSEYYPEAKILLTVRSAESWYNSFSKTILQKICSGNDPLSFGEKVISEIIFNGMPDDRAHAISVYEKNNLEVQRIFSPDRLLVYQLGAGWEPLCEFLNVPVPDHPFPNCNSTDDFRARFLKQ